MYKKCQKMLKKIVSNQETRLRIVFKGHITAIQPWLVLIIVVQKLRGGNIIREKGGI